MKNKNLFLLMWLLSLSVLITFVNTVEASTSFYGEWQDERPNRQWEKMGDRWGRDSVDIEFIAEIQSAVFDELDEDVLDELEDLALDYNTEKEDLMEEYEWDKEELMEALDDLKQDALEDFEDILPTESMEVLEELFEDRAEEMQEQKKSGVERVNEWFSDTTQTLINRLYSILDVIEGQMDNDPEKINAFYTKIINNMETMIDRFESNDDISETLKTERIELFEGIIAVLNNELIGLDTDESFNLDEVLSALL